MNQRFFSHETALIDPPFSIGENTKIWHYTHICRDVKIGRNCKLGQNVYVAQGVNIGNYCKIQNNVSIYGGVELEDYVFCGPSAVFTNILRPRCKYPQETPDKFIKTLVKTGASLGANSTIVCGITIGRHALVGAGAVVTKDVPEYAIVYGNPANQKGWVCECGFELVFTSAKTTCSKCAMKYEKLGGSVAPCKE